MVEKLVGTSDMAHSKAENVDELTAVVRNAAEHLNAGAIAALVANPMAVASALAITASTLSTPKTRSGSIESIAGATPVLDGDKESRERLDARTKKGRETGLLTSDGLAERAGLKTRQSIHDWLKKGRVLGWEGAKRGLVFPEGQLDERGRPLKGIDLIAELFPDGYAAWVWLTTPLRALDGTTPLSLLRKGEVDRVVAAARGDAQGDFA